MTSRDAVKITSAGDFYQVKFKVEDQTEWLFVKEDLKNSIPWEVRRWDGEHRCWLVHILYAYELRQWAERWFQNIVSDMAEPEPPPQPKKPIRKFDLT